MSKKLGPQNEKVSKAEFDVWLSRDLLFNNPPGQHLRVYPKYTKCKKIKYTHKILDYLDQMEDKPWMISGTYSGRACAVKLDGAIRYVWRSDLLSEEEYGKIQEKNRGGLRVIRKES